MGNGQSVEATRRPSNRLSKPRMNSSTNLLNLNAAEPPSRHNSLLNVAKRYSTLSIDFSVGEGSERESRSKKRMSMFRSKSAQPKSESLQIDSGVDIKFFDPTPVDNWSTRGSIATQSTIQPHVPPESRPLARPSRLSLHHVPYSQHHAQLPLVAEASQPPDRSEKPTRASYIQTEQAEKRRSLFLQEDTCSQNLAGLPERTNSETELFAPIRRRSLLQHGIATRKSWVENDARQSLPSQRPARDSDFLDYYYNPAKPTSSPLDNIAAMAPRLEDNASGIRTMTPNDLDYGHIGAFKLGSLRITNGAASPSPSEMSAARSVIDSYYMGERDSHQIDHDLALRSNTISLSQENIETSWITRAENPSSQRLENEGQPGRKSLHVNTHLPLPEFNAFNFNAETPTRSLDLAHAYRQDLPFSPFSFDSSPPRTPKLEATSKHMAMEDDLFEAEPTTPEIEEMPTSRSFDSGYRAENIHAKKAVTTPRDLAAKPLAKADSGYSSVGSVRSFTQASKPAPKPVLVNVAPPTPPKEPLSRAASSAYSVTSSYEVPEMTMRSKRFSPAVPTEHVFPPFREAPPVPLKHSSAGSSGKVIPSPLLPKKSMEQERPSATARGHTVLSPKHSRQQSIPTSPMPKKMLEQEWPSSPALTTAKHSRQQSIPTSPLARTSMEQEWPSALAKAPVVLSPKHARQQSIPAVPQVLRDEFTPGHSPSGSTGSESSGSTSRWRREKKQPEAIQPQPAYTIQAIRPDSQDLSVPPVPADISRHLEERVDSFPVTSFPNTIAGKTQLKRTVSKETLGTIFSVGSAECREESTFARFQSTLPPVQVDPTIPELPPPKPEMKKRHTSQPSTGPAPVPRGRSRQILQAAPRKVTPIHQSPQTFETNTFYESDSSIDESPKDTALDPFRQRPKLQARAKSMTPQVEAKARQRFASRNVSQDSLPALALQSAKSWDSNQFERLTSPPLTPSTPARGKPPSAHARYSGRSQSPCLSPLPTALLQQRSTPNFAHDDGGRLSVPSNDHLTSPPLVNMKVRKVNPNHISSQVKAPSRAPPAPPVQTKPEEKQDHWDNSKSFWAERRKPASEALQTRKSGDMGRPRTSKSRTSLDIQRPEMKEALQSRKSGEMRRPRTTRASLDQERPPMKSHSSLDVSQRRERNPTPPERPYDHTYGSNLSHDKENHHPNPLASHPYRHKPKSQEAEYYDSPSHDDVQHAQQQPHVQTIHKRQTSTSDMLVLDRFSGGFGYGYEPGAGLSGSAGTRNAGNLANGKRKSVDVSKMYGVDFSDIPVYLQRVEV